jgi:hypothetical protein
METLNMEIKNTGPVLTRLLQMVQTSTVSDNIYLTALNEDNPASGLQLSALGVNETALPQILVLLGIRSVTLNAGHDFERLAKLTVALPSAEVEQYLWAFFKDPNVINELHRLFSHCQTIAFDDWADFTGASNLWEGLLADVIGPLGRTDMEFIFYLGDPISKLSFQVDEAIELICEFSSYGKVTFALDESEALRLWMVLNGVNLEVSLAPQSPADLKRKYFSIFRIMNIARLLIYSANDAILFSKDQQFVLTRKKVEHQIEIGLNARQNFIMGFSIGLLKQLDIAHCIALGLIVFGSYGELNAAPSRQNLQEYIQKWIDDLQKPESMHLYE